MLLSTAKSKKIAAGAAALCPQVVSLSRAINRYAHAPVGGKVLMGEFQAERKHEVGGAYAWPKPALRGRPRPPGRPLAPPRASWEVWWRARRRAWPGAASRYRPREKVPKNTYLEKPILTSPSYSSLE